MRVIQAAALVSTAGLLNLGEEYDDSPDFGMAAGYTIRFGD